VNYEKMSREELVASLVALMAARSTQAAAADDAMRLFHDLQVHQLELEMQNRELREARSELEESRNRYADLYDFAPVAYFTLDGQGVVHDLNLCAANWLGHDRERIVGRPLLNFVTFSQPSAFAHHLGKCAARQHAAVSEFTIEVAGRAFDIEVTSVATTGIEATLRPKMFRTSFADITGRKRMAAELERARASEQVLRAQIQAVEQAHAELSAALNAAEQPVAKVAEVILRHAMALTGAERAELQFVDELEFGTEMARRYTSGTALPIPSAHFSAPLCVGGRALAVLSISRAPGSGPRDGSTERDLEAYGKRMASFLELARLQTLQRPKAAE